MKKRVAVIGYGGQGGFHADHIVKSDVVALSGVYDIQQARNELARAKGYPVYPSLEAVLSDPSAEIVVIATPNEVHEELSILALSAGKHVVCEKPVTLSLSSFDRITEAARRHRRLFTVHQNRRFDVDYLAMKALVEGGELGEVIHLESRIHGSRGIPSDWRGKKEHGGGMLLDWGVHIIDQALMLVGFDVESVFCSLDHITNTEVDDGFSLTLQTGSGKKAYLEVGTYNFLPMPRFYLRCQKGSAKIEDWQKNCQVAKCKAWHEKDVLPVLTAAGITKTMAPRDAVTLDIYELARPVSDVHDFYRNFVSAIDGECEQLVRWEESRRVLEVVMAAFRSAEKGAPVFL